MAERPLRPDQTAWLVATAGVSLLPHGAHLPAWLSAICVLLLGWRAYLGSRRQALPHRIVLLVLSLAIGGGVFIEYHHLFGKEPGIAMLAGFLCLKLLESNDIRGARAVVLLALFMQMGQFLYQQSIAIAALTLLGTMLSIASLLALEGRVAAPRQRLADAGLLLAQGMPLMLVLFVLFPRVPGPLWGLPADAFSAKTGLSDTMSPGSIAQLSQSGAIAFRARFEGEPPPPSERYWRGPVLTNFDGKTWRAARLPANDTPSYRSTGVAYPYTLTLEAHDRPWLLALDFPGPQAGLLYSADLQLLTREPVRTRLRMALVAYPQTPVGLDEHPAIRRLALRLPNGFNPRTVALGERLKAEARSPEDIPALAIAHFRRAGLSYTLNPPPLGRDDVDDFLFETRQGFCEHFAAAFVVTLRAAGIPARVVTGYQGGELNPVDGSLEIRQSDAHAWTEVWFAGRGWLRIDPTAATAPLRIEGGLAAALPNADGLPLLMRNELAWLRGVQHRMDAFNNSWNQWVLGYNPARQRDLLSGLGLGKTDFGEPDWAILTGLMTAGCALVMGALGFGLLRRHTLKDPIARSWDIFCKRLARQGLPRAAWEGPADYAARISALRPELADTVTDICGDYARLRYGPDQSGAGPSKRFHQSVKSFRPR